MLIRSVGLRGGGSAATPPPAGGPDGTLYYLELTIPAQTAILTDFPLYLSLADLPADFWTNVQADGGDIRVTEADGSTRCPVELVDMDAVGQTGELHFLGSSLSSVSSTVFRVYYGSSTTLSQPAVTDTYGRNAVWADYVGVWHLDEDPSAGVMADSTGSGFDATPNGSMTGSDSITGHLGRGVDLDGVDDYLDVGNVGALGSAYTVSAWVKPANLTTNMVAVSYRTDNSSSDNNVAIQLDQNVSGSGRILVRDDNDSLGSATGGSLSTSAWRHLAGRRDGDNLAVWVSGTKATGSNAFGPISMNRLILGALYNDFHTADWVQGFWAGGLDEVRLRAAALSDDWITSEQANQNDPSTFYSVGSQQSA